MTKLVPALVTVALGLIATGCRETTSTPATATGPFAPGEATLLSVGSPTKDEDANIIRARDGTIIVTWFSDRGGNSDIYLATTKDGRTWSSPVRVTTSPDGDFYPNLYQDDQGLFHMVWFRWSAPFAGHIIYNTSTDGVTWNPGAEVPATNAFNVDDWVPTITQAADGTLLVYFVSKRRTTGGQNDLYLAAKSPGATVWNAVIPLPTLSSPTAHDHLPFATRIGATVQLLWVRHDLTQELPWLVSKSDIYSATSTNGRDWSAPAKITNDAGNIVHLFPATYATLDQQWSIFWLSTRSGSPSVYELPAPGTGAYPQSVVSNTSLPPGYSHRIAATPVAGTYIGVWVQGPDGSQDIYYRVFKR
jgi:hypothetical protein